MDCGIHLSRKVSFTQMPRRILLVLSVFGLLILGATATVAAVGDAQVALDETPTLAVSAPAADDLHGDTLASALSLDGAEAQFQPESFARFAGHDMGAVS